MDFKLVDYKDRIIPIVKVVSILDPYLVMSSAKGAEKMDLKTKDS